MKTYKEMAEIIENHIDYYAQRDCCKGNLYFLVEAWAIYEEEDTETPKAEKCEKLRKIIEYIEKETERVNPDNRGADGILTLSITYKGLRDRLQKLENEGKPA